MTINVVGSQGDDDFTLTADAFDITSGAGENAFDLTGTYQSRPAQWRTSRDATCF